MSAEEQKTEHKYKVTEFRGPVGLHINYSTDDEDEFKAIQQLNEDKSKWKLQVDKDNIKVYSSSYKVTHKGKEVDNAMFYCEATINHPASEASKYLYTYALREKWETSLKKGKLLKEEKVSDNFTIMDYYSYTKLPLIYSDRDAVLRQKSWNNYQDKKDCFLSHIKSIDHPDYPEKDKPVRAVYDMRCDYLKPINATSCKYFVLARFDFKMNILVGQAAQGQAKAIKEFISVIGK